MKHSNVFDTNATDPSSEIRIVALIKKQDNDFSIFDTNATRNKITNPENHATLAFLKKQDNDFSIFDTNATKNKITNLENQVQKKDNERNEKQDNESGKPHNIGVFDTNTTDPFITTSIRTNPSFNSFRSRNKITTSIQTQRILR
jgi:hypothetical protein